MLAIVELISCSPPRSSQSWAGRATGRPTRDRKFLRVRLSRHRVDRHSSFLFGIMVGAVAFARTRMLLAGSRPPRVAAPRPDAKSPASNVKMAFVNRDRDTRLEHQQRADDTSTATTVNTDEGARPHRRSPRLGRWSRIDSR